MCVDAPVAINIGLGCFDWFLTVTPTSLLTVVGALLILTGYITQALIHADSGTPHALALALALTSPRHVCFRLPTVEVTWVVTLHISRQNR